jgi:hypothetical protein
MTSCTRKTSNVASYIVVNFICVRLFAVGNYYAIDCLHLTSLWRHGQVRVWVLLGCKTSCIIMWPLHIQSYCNISMKNGSNVVIKVRGSYRWYGWQSLFKHVLFHNEMLWIFKLYQWFHWNTHFSCRLIWQ